MGVKSTSDLQKQAEKIERSMPPAGDRMAGALITCLGAAGLTACPCRCCADPGRGSGARS